jgi:hypothetical protein
MKEKFVVVNSKVVRRFIDDVGYKVVLYPLNLCVMHSMPVYHVGEYTTSFSPFERDKTYDILQ